MVEKKTVKKAVTKKAVKPAKKLAAKVVVKNTVVKAAKSVKVAKVEPKIVKGEKVESTLTVSLFDVTGKQKGTVKLPEAVFGGKINSSLMAQAVRVYLANQRMGSAKTKTRGQVDGSTRKIYRQKGTGRARHGGIRAPIFVGGGVAHGPKVKDYSLDMPTKMKKASVVSALSSMVKDGKVVAIAGFTAIEPKTKIAAAAFSGMDLAGKKALLIMPEYVQNAFKAARNINNLHIAVVNDLTTYDVLNAGTVVVMQEALQKMEAFFVHPKK